MPKKFPPSSKRDVVTVARRGDPRIREVAIDFGVSEESVRRGVRQADIDGIKDGQTSTEQSELVPPPPMENEIRRRVTAFFASATLPK